MADPREAWRDGFDAAINMVEIAAEFAHGGPKTIGGNAVLRTAKSIARVRDDAEQKADERGVFGESEA